MSHAIPESDLAEALLRQSPRRDTYTGWQNWRTTRRSFVPAPKLSLTEWRALSPHERSLYDLHRTATHVHLPLQETPMSLKVSRLVNRRLRNNALKTRPSTRAGVMVTGWGYQGKTETVCEVAAAFEDAWLALHDHLNPNTVDGVRDLHAPVAYVQTPVTAKPKGACQAILNCEHRPVTSGLATASGQLSLEVTVGGGSYACGGLRPVRGRWGCALGGTARWGQSGRLPSCV